MREEARVLRAWLKVRGTFPGPDLRVQTKAADRRLDSPRLDEEIRRRRRDEDQPRRSTVKLNALS